MVQDLHSLLVVLLPTGLMIYAVPTGISFLLLGYLGIITLHWFTGPSVLMNYVGLNLYCPRYAGIPTGMTGDLYSLSINLYQDYPSLLLSMSLVLLVGMMGASSSLRFTTFPCATDLQVFEYWH